MCIEIWKPCPNFESKYLISNYGRIKSIGTYNTCKTGQLIKQYKKKGRNGYMQVRLYDSKRVKTVEVHTLVAKAFLPNPNNYKYVNHKDEDKTNNYVENLEWCTNQYNVWYSNHLKVSQYDKQGNFICTYASITEAAASIQSNTSNISKCCKGKRKTVKGFIFKYEL